MNEQTIFDFTMQSLKNKDVDFSEYKGKVILVVNVASKCGFTYQYAGLENLYQKYKDKGLVILGFPCNQFAQQESGTNDEIATFCSRTYGVSFPMFSKIDVNGKNQHDLYRFLKKKAKGLSPFTSIKWNFTKFLVSRDGKTVQRFAPTVKPEDLETDIEKLL